MTADHPAGVITIAQRGFDPLGPTVRRAALTGNRTVHYIDEGDPSWLPLLFFGGAGTTARAFGLLEFARTLREQLRIRVISVERNGLGQSAFDPDLDLAAHASAVWELVDRLQLGAVSLVAISGGGPYAAAVSARQPQRVRSLHLACAWSGPVDEPGAQFDVDAISADPVRWWRFPPHSPVHRIPGFVDSTMEEATRARFVRGRDVAPDGLRQAVGIYHTIGLPELDQVSAPAFAYWGADDQTVPLVHLDAWRKQLPQAPITRLYAGEGHDVQYRHWDQILADVAFLGSKVVVCSRGNSLLVDSNEVAGLIARGATLGLCAWS